MDWGDEHMVTYDFTFRGSQKPCFFLGGLSFPLSDAVIVFSVWVEASTLKANTQKQRNLLLSQPWFGSSCQNIFLVASNHMRNIGWSNFCDWLVRNSSFALLWSVKHPSVKQTLFLLMRLWEHEQNFSVLAKYVLAWRPTPVSSLLPQTPINGQSQHSAFWLSRFCFLKMPLPCVDKLNQGVNRAYLPTHPQTQTRSSESFWKASQDGKNWKSTQYFTNLLTKQLRKAP